jgi:guanylate kinase
VVGVQEMTGLESPRGAESTEPEAAAPVAPPATGILFIFSAPSGAGKDTVIQALKDEGFDLHFAKTCTTRARRATEVDGVHYYFISMEEFSRLREAGELLEWAYVHGNYYGVPRDPVRRALRAGKDVLLKIDVQGAMTVKSALPDAVLIFLLPPSAEEAVSRMRERGTESEDEIQRRIESLEREFNSLDKYDYVVENPRGQVHRAVEKVKAIIIAERCRVKRRRFDI